MIAHIEIELDCNSKSWREFDIPLPEATDDTPDDFYDGPIRIAISEALVSYCEDWILAEGVDDSFTLRCELRADAKGN